MTTSTTSTIPLTAGRWTVDYAHTSVGFTVRHLGVSKVRGRFNTYSADVVVGTDLATSSVDASIALGSIDTGNRGSRRERAGPLSPRRRPAPDPDVPLHLDQRARRRRVVRDHRRRDDRRRDPTAHAARGVRWPRVRAGRCSTRRASRPSPTCAARTSASASTSRAPCSATSSRSSSTCS